jgi:hypothetical protein
MLLRYLSKWKAGHSVLYQLVCVIIAIIRRYSQFDCAAFSILYLVQAFL